MLAEYRSNMMFIVNALLRRDIWVVVLGQPHFESRGCSALDSSHFWNGGIGEPGSGRVTDFFSDGVLDELALQVNAAAKSVADELGVAYLDLDRFVPSNLQHYYDQFHFTPAGADAVGKAVAAFLSKELHEREVSVNCV